MASVYRTLPMHFISSEFDYHNSTLLTILEGRYQNAELPRLVDMLSKDERDIVLDCLDSSAVLGDSIFNLKLELEIRDLRYAVTRLQINGDIIRRLLGSDM